nr:hypothetical protein [Tanacetum cinerariifolium]
MLLRPQHAGFGKPKIVVHQLLLRNILTLMHEGNLQQKEYKEKGVIDSGCSRHMIGNKCYLTDFKAFDGGFASFRDGKGRISGKGKIKTGKLDFGDVYFCETNGILKASITGIENQLDCKVKVIRSDNGTEFKNIVMTQFCDNKGIKREYSVARTPQQNRVAERRNKTLIGAARTMALVTKPHNKTPYELIRGRPPLIDFMKPFGCPVTILNTRDNLGKFEGKANEGYFVRYSVVRTGPDWLFDIDSITISMNYVPVVIGYQASGIAGTKEKFVAGQDEKKKELKQEYILIPICTTGPLISQDDKDSAEDAGKKAPEVDVCEASDNGSTNAFEEHSFERFYPFKKAFSLPHVPMVTPIDNTKIFGNAYDDDVLEEDVVMNNVDSSYAISEATKGQIDKTLFIKRHKDDILIVQVYVDDIIFRSAKKEFSIEFEKLMHDNFLMISMGELSFFLGLQVKQKSDEIFISQDKYVVEILKKFDFVTVKTTSTLRESNKPLIKDEEAEDVDVHLYRLLIGLLIYLTTSRRDITFVVCACARPLVSKDSSFDQEAYSDSNYSGASLDRKSTTGCCQFLGKRLISWQCKKQTIVANTTTEPEYVAAANYCGQNPVFHSKTKHIERRYHFIREAYEKKLIQVIKIHTEKMLQIFSPKPLILVIAKDGRCFVDTYEVTPGNTLLSTAGLTTIGQRVNEQEQIQALVDKKMVILTEDNIRNDLRVDDAEGTACLLNMAIFEGLARMGHKEMYVISSHTKKIFANMRRIRAGFSGVVTPLFDTMMVQAAADMDDTPVATHQTPIVDQPSTSRTKKKQKPRGKQRKEAEVSHDESEDEDHIPTHSSDPLPSEAKDAQSKEITALKKKVSKLIKWKKSISRGLRRLMKISSGRRVKSPLEKDSLVLDTTTGEHEEQIIEDVSTAEPVTTTGEVVTIIAKKVSAAPTTYVTEDEITMAQALAALKSTKHKVMVQEQEKKDQTRMDEEYAKQLEAEEQERDEKDKQLYSYGFRSTKEQWKKAQESSTKRTAESLESNISKKQKVDENVDLVIDDTEEVKKCMEIVLDDGDEVQIEATPISSRSPTIIDYKIHKEGKKNYFKIIRADGNSQVYQTFEKMFKNFNREDVKVLWAIVKDRFKKEKPVDDMDSLLFRTLKTMFEHHVKINDDKETTKLQQLVKIIPDEERVAIDAIPLAVKPPSIVDWKIQKEGKKSYYKIIKANGSSKIYLIFSHMLKDFNREDVETLWKLVKAKYGSTRPEGDYERVLRGDLKVMFELHIKMKFGRCSKHTTRIFVIGDGIPELLHVDLRNISCDKECILAWRELENIQNNLICGFLLLFGWINSYVTRANLDLAPRAWYETLANYLLENGFHRGKIDQTLFIKKQKGDILLVQIYVDDIIFGVTNKDLCKSFEKLMKDKFQMSSIGELTFFLGLQVKQKKDGIFISQDKYVAEILKKFGLTEGKSASTPIDIEKPLLKDPDGEDVDVHIYRLISWQCKKQTVVATSSTEAEYIVAANCCAQVLWIQNQLLDYGSGILLPLNSQMTSLEGVDCLPNEEIFTGLARMGYEKPSTKLTFYKAFFSSQWKFLIHAILQSMSAKRTSWNEFSSAMASAVICLSTGRKFNFSKYIFESLVRNVDSSSKFYMYHRFIQLIIQNQLGDLSTHTTKYIFPALTQKVFENMRRVGKGCSRVETPLFEGMLVAGEPEEQGDLDEEVQGNDNDAAQGADPADDEALDACAALTKRVENLEHDKVAEDLEIIKLKTRVKKLERVNKGRMIAELYKHEGAALMSEKEEEKKAEEVKDITGDAQVERRQAKIYQIDIDHVVKVLSMQEDEPKVQEAVEVVTTAKLITEVVAAVSEAVSAASANIAAAVVPAATITAGPVKVAAAST